MATILCLLAILPAFYGVMITGDFSQYAYKPSHKQVYFVLQNRAYLIGASIVLWVGGLIWHLLISPTAWWVLILCGLLTTAFIIAGFFMPAYILFQGVHQPQWLTVEEAKHVSPDEPIIGLNINGDARAYPVDAILRPHMVHHTVGGEPVSMTYCMLCNTAMAFKPELAGQKLNLIAPMQWENNLMLYDPDTGNLVQQITGEILYGPAAGQNLSQYPTQIMSWQAWQSLHPQTKVLHHPPQGIFDKFVRTMLRTQIFEPNFKQTAPIFPTIKQFDERLANKAEVLGVCVETQCKAYPITYLQQHPVLNEQINQTDLLVAYDGQQDIGDVFYSQHEGQKLTFTPKTDGDSFRLLDAETNSTWTMTGEAIAGPLQEAKLNPYPHFNRVLWFSWFNFYPQTEVAL